MQAQVPHMAGVTTHSVMCGSGEPTDGCDTGLMAPGQRCPAGPALGAAVERKARRPLGADPGDEAWLRGPLLGPCWALCWGQRRA